MESAEAVAADVSRSISVTIEISNATKNYCLINPRYVLRVLDHSWYHISDVFLFLCCSGSTLKAGKRTTHLSPRCALWWQRFALSQSPAAFQAAASASWRTSFWRRVRLRCPRRWPSCSQFPGTTTFTTTGLQWESIKQALNVMRGCINKCTMRRNRRSMDLSGRKPMGQESVMLGVTLISGPLWIPWGRQSWRWRCGINFSHFPSTVVSIHLKLSAMNPNFRFNPSISSSYQADCV